MIMGDFQDWDDRCIVFTLTFDSSPIKGEGDLVGVVWLSAPRCRYCLKASMTDPGRAIAPLDCGSSPQ